MEKKQSDTQKSIEFIKSTKKWEKYPVQHI